MAQTRAYIHGTQPDEQARLATLNNLTNASFLDFLNVGPDEAVLEIGSGLGILANDVARRFPDALVTGIEIAHDQIDRARTGFPYTPNLRFIEGSALALPFRASSFDVVYCRYLLEHVPTPQNVLAETFRVLKAGGKVFAQENNILINALYPDCPTYSVVLHRFADLQTQLGGDAEIGKKLFSLMKGTEFVSINLSIEPEVHHHDMPTFDPWIVNSMEILKGARTALLGKEGVSEPMIHEALRELDSLRKNPHGSAYFYWNRASAVKL